MSVSKIPKPFSAVYIFFKNPFLLKTNTYLLSSMRFYTLREKLDIPIAQILSEILFSFFIESIEN
jgi:hypothetical protein